MEKCVKLNYEYYGLRIFEVGSHEWAIGNRAQLHKAAKAKIKDDLWSFSTRYLADFLAEKYPDKYRCEKTFNAISLLQDKLCEDAGPILQAMLGEYLDEFCEETIKAHGIEFVLSFDDKIKNTRDVDGLKPGYGPLCFRID